MRPATTSLHIPQTCHESWAAMTPTAAGRHCAACAKTVIDFTLKTDAEILAYLAGAATGRTCGRFAAGQLERPLQRAAPAAPSGHWRAWLAAAVAVWGLRTGIATEANAQAATEWRARYWGGPVPAAPVADAPNQQLGGTKISRLAPAADESDVVCRLTIIQHFPDHLDSLKTPPLVLRGIITDASTNQGLPGVTVLLKGTTVGISTKADGSYELTVPPEMASRIVISVSSVGSITQERVLAREAAGAPQNFSLQWQRMGALVAISPLPWHPRAFYYWGKYWFTRPFRRE